MSDNCRHPEVRVCIDAKMTSGEIEDAVIKAMLAEGIEPDEIVEFRRSCNLNGAWRTANQWVRVFRETG